MPMFFIKLEAKFDTGSVNINTGNIMKVENTSSKLTILFVNLLAASIPCSFSILINIGIYVVFNATPIKAKITVGIVNDIK